jgi:hypothetical protein
VTLDGLSRGGGVRLPGRVIHFGVVRLGPLSTKSFVDNPALIKCAYLRTVMRLLVVELLCQTAMGQI